MTTATLPAPVGAQPSRRTRRRRVSILFIVATATAILLSAVSLCVGAVPLAPAEAIGGLFGDRSNVLSRVVLDFQMPRTVLAWAVGAGLATSGVLMQSVVRNPLASPDVLGVTKGAGAIALLALLLLPGLAIAAVPLFALLGGFIVAALIYVLAYRGGTTPMRLAFVGIALGACCEAVIRFLLMRYPQNVNSALTWLAGSLYGRTWDTVLTVVPLIVIALPVALFLARRVEIMALGDAMATGLGEKAERTRRVALALSVVLAAAAVAGAGTIGFVGLVAPHIARRVVGGKLGQLLPMSILVGVLLMLGADIVGRSLMPPLEVPAGLITAVIGAPYFIYLLMRSRK